jgi:hypothetical protein
MPRQLTSTDRILIPHPFFRVPHHSFEGPVLSSESRSRTPLYYQDTSGSESAATAETVSRYRAQRTPLSGKISSNNYTPLNPTRSEIRVLTLCSEEYLDLHSLCVSC